jgi:hypothetical protein
MPSDDTPLTPWQTATAQKKSQRQEQRNANLPGGRKQVNSGRHWFSKRDNRLHGFLIETRRTDSDSYRITLKEFESIMRDALTTPPGLKPGMQIDIKHLKLMLISLDDYIDLQLKGGLSDDT